MGNAEYMGRTKGLQRSSASALRARSLIAGICSPSVLKALPTRPSTGLPSKVVVWCAGKQPSPPWLRGTTTSVSPPSPGLQTSHLPAPSLWLYYPTHLGYLCNTATENLVDTNNQKYIYTITRK